MTFKELLQNIQTRFVARLGRFASRFSWQNIKFFLSELPARLRRLTARDVVAAIENRWERFKNVLNQARTTYYRVVVMRSETFEEVGAYRISLMNVYVSLSSLFVALTVLVSLLFMFTPLKKIIPGFGGSEAGRNVLLMQEDLEKLTSLARANETYIADRMKFLTGKYEYEEDAIKNQPPPEADTTLEEDVSTIAEDGDLRQAVSTGSVVPRITIPTPKNGASNGLQASNLQPLAGGRLENMVFVAPVSGEISQGYNAEKRHYGLDITAPKNTAIKAAADGFVISADWTLETGNTIAVQHNNNVVTFYKHNTSNLKRTGDRVKAGEAIAIIGSTGEQSSGPHLHFELWYNGKPVNPQEYLRF